MTITLGILASGEGTSVESLETKIQNGTLTGFEIAVVACNKPPGQAGVYVRAEKLGLPCVYAPTMEQQAELFGERDVDVVLCLGYTQKVGKALIEKYGRLIWNIHPALLPKHSGRGMYGLAPHRAVIESGEKETGATVHMMTEEYDSGDILQQVRIPVFQGETPEQLQQRVLHFEHALVAATLALYRDNVLPNCPRG